jgi:hypothetical protein
MFSNLANDQIITIAVSISGAIASILAALFGWIKAKNLVSYQVGVKFREHKLQELSKFFDIGLLFPNIVSREELEAKKDAELLEERDMYTQYKGEILRFYFRNKHFISNSSRANLKTIYGTYLLCEKKFDNRFERARQNYISFVVFTHALNKAILDELEVISDKLALSKDRK